MEVLKVINDIDTALMFYHVAGASIDKGKFGFIVSCVVFVVVLMVTELAIAITVV